MVFKMKFHTINHGEMVPSESMGRTMGDKCPLESGIVEKSNVFLITNHQ